MQTNRKCFKKWVYKYYPTLGKVTTAVYSHTVKQEQENPTQWSDTALTRYIHNITLGYRSNFM